MVSETLLLVAKEIVRAYGARLPDIEEDRYNFWIVVAIP